ncbi:MAG TPA: hypothetical protein VGO68_05765 [Pyrinomonadaceae bacterium]|jgi:hypothetical protein|nr:hypothetical protein [Pyrinomonadaceae bacterium]
MKRDTTQTFVWDRGRPARNALQAQIVFVLIAGGTPRSQTIT